MGKRREEKPAIEDAELDVMADDVRKVPKERRDLFLFFVFEKSLQVGELPLPAGRLPLWNRKRWFFSANRRNNFDWTSSGVRLTAPRCNVLERSTLETALERKFGLAVMLSPTR